MKKKIYTFTLILFVVLLSLYFVWALAANIQKEALQKNLRDELAFNVSNERITTYGFPFKFGVKVSNFQSPLKHIPLSLQFLKLDIIRLIYNFSDVILFVEKPIITSTGYPKFNSSANKLKVSISNRPFSGSFKLISEQEDWQISADTKLRGVEAKKVIFALKDMDKMKLAFYLRANDLSSSFFNKIQERDPEKPNELILKGTISNNFISNPNAPYRPIKLESIMLEQLDINIGLLKLGCNDAVAINLINLTSEGDINCLLRLSSKDISKIETDNELLKRIIGLINLLLIIKNPTNTDETQAVPVKFSLDKGLFYINTVPIYQFPRKY